MTSSPGRAWHTDLACSVSFARAPAEDAVAQPLRLRACLWSLGGASGCQGLQGCSAVVAEWLGPGDPEAAGGAHVYVVCLQHCDKAKLAALEALVEKQLGAKYTMALRSQAPRGRAAYVSLVYAADMVNVKMIDDVATGKGPTFKLGFVNADAAARPPGGAAPCAPELLRGLGAGEEELDLVAILGNLVVERTKEQQQQQPKEEEAAGPDGFEKAGEQLLYRPRQGSAVRLEACRRCGEATEHTWSGDHLPAAALFELGPGQQPDTRLPKPAEPDGQR
mmetsp:Transcript_643/g.2039  ORF Transcript_643/g.2039 Transcript_643/m.2039 type:complete len:278 (-) Transcript_643:42-875(-)